ncbi:hypothetical protein GCM10010278_04550 [Streptomyces melanogenes]|nr:hypothetical protein GCM10010278_04550 [Streptomyces melanogenes]
MGCLGGIKVVTRPSAHDSGADRGQEFVAGIRWRPRSRHREGVDTRITSYRDGETTTAVCSHMPGSPQLVDSRPGFPWPLRCECSEAGRLPTLDFPEGGSTPGWPDFAVHLHGFNHGH